MLIRGGLLLLLQVATVAGAGASQYSQPGFYTPEIITMANGLTVILKQRSGAPNVSLRLVVGVGHDDFGKGRKQTAHQLEHLLYMGTARHDETEIDRLIQDHGGYSNAFTGSAETIHHLDIFREYYLWGLDFLFELITEASLSEENVQRAAEVIHREEGGTPSSLHRWLYEHEVTKHPWALAHDRLLANPDYQFGLETCESITRAELTEVFRRFYVPANMALVVVGNFEREELLAGIARTFGGLETAPRPERIVWDLPYPKKAAELNGTLAPVLDSEGIVQMMFRTEGFLSPDFYVLQVVGKYLDQKIIEKLRFERGLAYDPGSSYFADQKWGVITAGGTVELERMDEVRGLVQEEFARLLSGQVTAAEIEKAKRQILLAQAGGYESNASFADYYAGALPQLQRFGHYLNYEDAIAAVSPDQVAAVAARYFLPERRVTVLSRPTLTIEQLAALAGLLLVLAAFLLWRWRRRRRPGMLFVGRDV